jgi:hypothetical protein
MLWKNHPVETSGKSFRIWITTPYSRKEAHIVFRRKISLIQGSNDPVFAGSIVMDSRTAQLDSMDVVDLPPGQGSGPCLAASRLEIRVLLTAVGGDISPRILMMASDY